MPGDEVALVDSVEEEGWGGTGREAFDSPVRGVHCGQWLGSPHLFPCKLYAFMIVAAAALRYVGVAATRVCL